MEVKTDTEQVLKVDVTVANIWVGWQFFYAKISKDRRIVVPKLRVDSLRDKNPNLLGHIMEVNLEPT